MLPAMSLVLPPPSPPPASPFAPPASVCLRITTGVGSNNDGSINIAIDTGSGYSWVSTGSSFSQGSTVLNNCYSALLGVQVRNPTSDAWTGTVESSNDGGSSWSPLSCSSGCQGGTGSAQFSADGNSDGVDQAATVCLNGATCTLLTGTLLMPVGSGGLPVAAAPPPQRGAKATREHSTHASTAVGP